MAALDFLFGESREDVKLPSGLTETQEERRRLLERLRAPGRGQAAREAVTAAGQQQLQQLGRRAQSRVASARGPARLLAERAAEAGMAEAGAGIAAQTAAAAARAEQEQEARDIAAQLGILDQLERGEITMDQLREERRRKGALPALTTAAGGLAGSLFGQPVAGASLGQSLGQAAVRQ